MNWSQKEASSLRRFLNTPAGEAMGRSIKENRPKIFIKGLSEREHDIQAGSAQGWEDCWEHILSLANAEDIEDKTAQIDMSTD